MRLLLLLLAACSSPPSNTPEPDAATGPSPEEQAARALAATAADDLGKTLKTRLVSEMKAGGPMAAVRVCSQQAGSLTAEVAARHGVRLGRSSLRLRNPANRGPDWVEAWLESAEENSEPILRVAGAGGSIQHLRPLRIEAPCLACHGASPHPDVATHLAEHYPTDRATGYALGDLRGALWVEVPIASP